MRQWTPLPERVVGHFQEDFLHHAPPSKLAILLGLFIGFVAF
jgi:hypothetical protein